MKRYVLSFTLQLSVLDFFLLKTLESTSFSFVLFLLKHVPHILKSSLKISMYVPFSFFYSTSLSFTLFSCSIFSLLSLSLFHCPFFFTVYHSSVFLIFLFSTIFTFSPCVHSFSHHCSATFSNSLRSMLLTRQ